MTKILKLTSDAAEAIRAANHATSIPGRLTVPETYSVIAELYTMAYRSDQLCRQLAHNLETRLGLGGLAHDNSGDPAAAVAQACAYLVESAARCSEAGRLLSEAQNRVACVSDHGGASR